MSQQSSMREAFLCTTVWTVESGQKEMISDFQAYLSKNKVYLYLIYQLIIVLVLLPVYLAHCTHTCMQLLRRFSL